MNKLELYDKIKSVPKEAQKEILGGRLKGKTDINPMWRIKTLTEQFGIAGFGWKTEIKRQWLEKTENGETAAFVEIDLFIKHNGEWSDAIVGIGGSMFVENQKAGLYTNDECFKMAYTDAISVACKAIGMGAEIYWDKDKTKYSQKEKQIEYATTEQIAELKTLVADLDVVAKYFKKDKIEDLTKVEIQSIIDRKKASK